MHTSFRLGFAFALAFVLSGCGGSSTPQGTCGNQTCAVGQTCVNNTCQSPPACGSKTCAAGQTCVNNTCQNQPACGGKTCAAGQICVNNTCQTPTVGHCGDGKCQQGETPANCCQDCGCARGLVCTAGACVQGSYCGDGICQPTESMNTCCLDCGCPAGSACNGKQCVAVSTTATMTFTLDNGCLDDVDFRFFDDAEGGVWPSASSYWTVSSGDTVQQSITCVIGDSICYGADTTDGTFTWGVGTGEDFTCPGDDCCATCGDVSSVVVPTFTCD